MSFEPMSNAAWNGAYIHIGFTICRGGNKLTELEMSTE